MDTESQRGKSCVEGEASKKLVLGDLKLPQDFTVMTSLQHLQRGLRHYRIRQSATHYKWLPRGARVVYGTQARPPAVVPSIAG
jgi:hypothetical protein